MKSRENKIRDSLNQIQHVLRKKTRKGGPQGTAQEHSELCRRHQKNSTLAHGERLSLSEQIELMTKSINNRKSGILCDSRRHGIAVGHGERKLKSPGIAFQYSYLTVRMRFRRKAQSRTHMEWPTRRCHASHQRSDEEHTHFLMRCFQEEQSDLQPPLTPWFTRRIPRESLRRGRKTARQDTARENPP